MPFPEDIRRGIDSLKQMCDPSGHQLLDAIGNALCEAAQIEDRLETQLDLLAGREIVEGHQVFPRVESPILMDNDRWSRRADLRAV